MRHCTQCVSSRATASVVRFAVIMTALLVALTLSDYMRRGLPLTEMAAREVLLSSLNFTVVWFLLRAVLHYPHEPPPRTAYFIKLIGWLGLIWAGFVCLGVIAAWAVSALGAT